MITFSKIGKYGRIGNQMFQYAALIGISNKIGFDWGLNIYKSNDMWNCFSLDEVFELDIKPLKSEILNQYKEPHFHFCKDVFNISDNTDIFGYFQSYKYFEHYQCKILKQFVFKKEHQIKVKQYGTDFTSIHVRRGDYIGNNAYFICDINYYNEACKIIGDNKYLIFSDDIGWCKNNFIGNKFEIIEGLSDYESLCLMSKGKNNIMANSSFSWWASYLNSNVNKKIIAPAKWFDGLQHNTKDLYIEDWIMI